MQFQRDKAVLVVQRLKERKSNWLTTIENIEKQNTYKEIKIDVDFRDNALQVSSPYFFIPPFIQENRTRRPDNLIFIPVNDFIYIKNNLPEYKITVMGDGPKILIYLMHLT